MEIAVDRVAGELSVKLIEIQRKRTVDEGGEVVVVGIEGADRGIEVSAQAGRPLHPGCHHGDESLVWMQILSLIPVLAGEAQKRGQDHDSQESNPDRVYTDPLDDRGGRFCNDQTG